jgi:cellulose synthase/poly-beta-1,6-N-acetylglucosamine synthase-like glycosyltransferase
VNRNEAFDPIAVLLIDVPESDVGTTPSWGDLPGLPVHGYRRARIYLRYKGMPFAKLNVEIDERGIPLEPVPELPRDVVVTSRAPVPTEPSTLPLVSIVVSTAGRRPDLLKRCIKSLTEINYPAFEIVVVDNRAESITDESEAIWTASRIDAGDDAHLIRVVREGRRGLSFARNTGVLAARGAIVAFTDDDVEVDANWLTGIVEAFNRSEEIMCVTGLVIPAELETEAQELCEIFYGGFDRGLVPRTWSILRRRAGDRGSLRKSSFRISEGGSTEHSHTKSIYVVAGNCGVGANFAARRDFALSCPFDVALGVGSVARSGEDTRFYADVLWAGYQVAYVPSSIVRHTHRRGMDELMNQMRGVGVGLTAYLASLIFEDPRHLIGIMLNGAPSALFRWIRSAFSGQSAAAGRDEKYTYSPSFRRTEIIGMTIGPWLYLASRRHARSVKNVD